MSLALSNISVAIERKTVVQSVSFEVGAGEIVLLIGPNGSGKSTLANALMGHPQYVVTDGSIGMDGVAITSYAVHEKARAGLFLSEQYIPKIAGLTLATFLHTAHQVRTGTHIDILEYYVQTRSLLETYGLDPDLLDRPLTAGLSGGQKKLSEIVQLAVLAPRYAILDEIDSGVDIDAVQQVFRVVTQLALERKTGFLLVSHHPSILTHCTPTTVHLMSGGTIVRSGGPDLLRDVQQNGFCKAVQCPLVSECKTNTV